VAADDGDRTSVAAGQRERDGDAQVGQALGGPVLAGDRGGISGLGVEVVLEEVAAAARAHAVAAVEQPLADRLAGEGDPAAYWRRRAPSGGVWGTSGGAQERGTLPDARAQTRPLSWDLSQKVAFVHERCPKWRQGSFREPYVRHRTDQTSGRNPDGRLPPRRLFP
jgi:hypothetical protein